MPSLLLVVFLVELALQVVNAFGTTAIANALWRIYSSLPSPRAAEYAEQRKLQAEYLAARRELQATSSQDEFAKWARLRRQHDKLLEQLEKKKTALDTDRRSFDSAVTIIRLVLTRGLQYFLPFWFAKAPMFWLPYGWFPGYAEYLLAFPRAPRGSVSITSWQLACTGVLALLRETVQALVVLWQSKKTEQTEKSEKSKTRTKETPMAAKTD